MAIYAIALIGGVTVAFDNPARRAFVVEMVPLEDVNNAVSINSALMTASRVIGPAVAGLLITTVGFGWCFIGDGVSYIAVIAGLYLMRTEELRPSPVAVRARGQVRDGLRYVRSVPELFVPLAMMAVVGTLSYNFQTVFPLFATRDLHGTAATYTLLFSVVSVGALAGALVAAHRKRTTIRTVAMSSIAYGAALGVMTFVPNTAAACVVGVVLGLASIAFLTSSTAIVQIEAAPEMRGRVLAIQAMLFLGTTPIGGPIVGFIAETLGARAGIGIGAVAGLAAGGCGLLADRRRAANRQGEGAVTERTRPGRVAAAHARRVGAAEPASPWGVGGDGRDAPPIVEAEVGPVHLEPEQEGTERVIAQRR
jgi:MFS family permease